MSALILFVFGGIVQMAAAQVPARAFKEGRLVNTGIYAYIRHPMYAGWILLFSPGIALFFHSWLMLMTSLAGYIGFKYLIKAEDEYLANKFGEAYLEYCSKVDALFPFNRFKKRL
jgi:protein-S-isoprenylcysteine O-methyltransferase Ste14